MKHNQHMNSPPKSGKGEVSASSRWDQLDMKRQGMIRRFEDYASVTIPRVCLPDNVDQFTHSIQHDWTSFGAQAVNHLTNKITLNLFRPGVPFFRLDPNREMQAELAAAKIPEEALRESLVSGEQAAMRVMDQKAIRPKLNEAVLNLIVVGNTLLDFTDRDNPRVFGIKEYVVKRSISGKVVEIMIRERVLYNELDEDAKAYVPVGYSGDEASFVNHFRWYRMLTDGRWDYSQHVDHTMLPKAEFGRFYKADDLPLKVLTWNLADKHDYGTGMVEDYAGDFGTLSTLSEAEIKASILASDYRWRANPASVGDIADVKNSVTGDVLPGAKDDLELIALGDASAVQWTAASAERVIRRLGAAFLLASAVTRDAERVTAQEIRLQAMELETSLGGVYSRLAQDLQIPIAVWLLDQIDVKVQGTKLIPTIVTGLAALSRNAEAQQLGMFLESLVQLATIPPLILQRIKLSNTISVLASAQGLRASDYVKDENTVAQEQAAAEKNAVDQEVTVNAAKEGARSLANGATNERT